MPSAAEFYSETVREQRRGELHRVLNRYREQVETRRRADLQKVELALRLLREVQVSATEDLLVGALAPEEGSSKRVSQLTIVRSSARTFGKKPFSLDELCARAEETFLGCFLERRIASRRLYDLRRASPPIIEIVSAEKSNTENLVMKRHTNLYQYTGPP